MKALLASRRNLLILLSLVAVGFSYEDLPCMAAVHGGLWFLALRAYRPKPRLGRHMEQLITLVAVLAAYHLGPLFASYSRLVFVGNGLVIYQLLHLMRAETEREKRWSIVVALVHLGIGTQMIVAMGFLVMLAAALVLIPAALYEVEAERFRRVAAGYVPPLRRRDFAVLAVLMIVFTIFLPRSRWTPPGPGRGGRGLGPQAQDIDMSDTIGPEANELLLCRVEGEDLDLLRSFVLDKFDGQRWSASPWVLRRDRFLDDEPPPGARRRVVAVVAPGAFQAARPTDGHVLAVDSDSRRQRLYMTDGDVVLAQRPRRRPFEYVYWSTERGPVTALDARARARYLDHPEPSPEVRQWLGQVAPEGLAGAEAARRLVDRFRNQFAYELGAPALDRMEPVDDFLLREQRGHCERFAGALAYLLRVRGVPSRVVLGYVARERNNLGGFYNIRTRHGHAWTEAWFEDRGWTTLDATPYGASIELEVRPAFSTLYEWVEYHWYAHVVEFDARDQNDVVEGLSGAVSGVANWVWRYLAWIVTAMAVIAALLVARRLRWRWSWPGRQARQRPRELTLREARHFYGQMLKALARQNYRRDPHRTPREFAATVAAADHPASADVNLVTEAFCRLRYGRHDLSPASRDDVHAALARISKPR